MFVIKILSICLITLFCSSISSTASIDFSVKSRDLQFLMVDMEILFICLITMFLLNYLSNVFKDFSVKSSDLQFSVRGKDSIVREKYKL